MPELPRDATVPDRQQKGQVWRLQVGQSVCLTRDAPSQYCSLIIHEQKQNFKEILDYQTFKPFNY